MKWYKKSQFTEKIDEDVMNTLFHKDKKRKRLEPFDSFNSPTESILPKDEDLRYFQDALSVPTGKTLNDEERENIINEMKREKSSEDYERQRRREERSERRKIEELKEDWRFYKVMHEESPSIMEDFLKNRGYEHLINNNYVKELLRTASNTFNLKQYAKKNKEDKIPLTFEERQEVKDKFGSDLECSFAKDKDGYYCYTHRARSDSYSTISKIPKSKVEFIGSTG